MEFSQVVRRRRMVRNYDPTRAVPRAVIDRMLEHAIRAPSAGFSQGWDFVVLTEQSDRDRFWSVSTGGANPADDDSWLRGVRHAPCLILCCSDKETYLARYAEPDKGLTDRSESHWPVPYWDIDTGMAALLLLLTAVDEGLGALFFGVQQEHQRATHEAFDIPGERTIVGIVAVGYAAPDRKSPSLKRGRRDTSQVAHEGRFGQPWRAEPDR